jgi:hypothetical protein
MWLFSLCVGAAAHVLRAKKAEEVKEVGGKAIHRPALVPARPASVNPAAAYDLALAHASNVGSPLVGGPFVQTRPGN